MAVKGVIVAAGYGTRFLPITRCVPKEMLPIVDRPVLDLIVEELVQAGIEDLLVVTSRRKKSMEDWFDRDPELEVLLEGSQDRLARIVPPAVRVLFARQKRMAGTGDALLLAREFAGADPVVVAYPDDLFSPPNCTTRLIETWGRTGMSVLSAQDLGEADVSRYGVLEVVQEGEELQLRRIVEKPPAGSAPSSLISLGRYLFTPDLFAELEVGRRKHRGGEYYHIPAINALANRGRVAVCVFEGARYDTGSPLGYLQTVIDFALAREDVGPALEAWLKGRLGHESGSKRRPVRYPHRP